MTIISEALQYWLGFEGKQRFHYAKFVPFCPLLLLASYLTSQVLALVKGKSSKGHQAPES